MAKISPQEVMKLAKISHITIEEKDVTRLTQEIEDILNYASFLQEIAANKKTESSMSNINVFREDIVKKTDTQTILADAPCVQDNYFVVPAIIKQ